MEFLAELHPKIVHFPVVLLILYPFFELAYLLTKKDHYSRSGLAILMLGVLSALFAVLTGNEAAVNWTNWSEQSKAVFNEHQTFANITMWYFSVILLFRIYLTIKKKSSKLIKVTITTLAFIGIIFVFLASNYGGKLVFDHGIGVEKLNSDE